MKNYQRILGIFAASAALGFGMMGCQKKEGVSQKTAQDTTITIFKQAHIVRETISADYDVGADFQQNMFFKTTVAYYNDAPKACTIETPFADIKDEETLKKIAYLKTFYDQAMAAPKPAAEKPAAPAPAGTP